MLDTTEHQRQLKTSHLPRMAFIVARVWYRSGSEEKILHFAGLSMLSYHCTPHGDITGSVQLEL